MDNYFESKRHQVENLSLVITAGGTSEPIDKVRKITNMSKGTLGRALFEEAYSRDAISHIYYLAPKSAFPREPGKYHFFKNVQFVETNSTADLESNLQKILTENRIHAICHSMAVSDYTVDSLFDVQSLAEHLHDRLSKNTDVSVENLLSLIQSSDYRIDHSSKVSSSVEHLCIQLRQTEKIISKIKGWSPDAMLIGFKLLENVTKEALFDAALTQKAKNGCSYVFANDIHEIRQHGHCGYLIEDEKYYRSLVGLKEITHAILDVVEGKPIKRGMSNL